MIGGRLIAWLADRCLFCGQRADSLRLDRLCGRCDALLPRNRPCCHRCARPLAVDTGPGIDCASCQRRPPAWRRAVAPLLYAFPVDVAIKRLKFSRQAGYGALFADLLATDCGHAFAGCDALVPVPLHRWRHIGRGYNQAREICLPLARHTRLPVLDHVWRCRATAPQAGLGEARRRRNLRGAFAVRGALGARHPLIVDDVLTTGSTCGQLAACLLDAGAERVSVLAVAHADRPRQSGHRLLPAATHGDSPA